MIFYIGNTAHI